MLILRFWGLTTKILSLKYLVFHYYSLIHFGSVQLQIREKFIISNNAQPRKICPSKYLGLRYVSQSFFSFIIYAIILIA